MERKNYLVEDLSNEEKAYLKRIIMTARNKYIKRNYNYINNTYIILDDEITVGESVLEEVLRKCQNEVKSALEFENLITNPYLYNIVKKLSLREKEVLFYLYKEQKSIKEITKIMRISRSTVERIRKQAQEKIARNLVRGE